MMNGLVHVDQVEKRGSRKGSKDSVVCSSSSAPHRRTKSASDRSLEIARDGYKRSAVKHVKQSTDLPPRSCRASPLHKYSASNNDDITGRVSLENDIDQLQMRLQQEKSMRMLLERAIGRTSSTLSPGHRHFSVHTEELIAEIEMLEEEVANREQHVLSLYRSIFENSVSRSCSGQSSVVDSPAHTKNESRKHPSIISSTFCSSKGFPLRTLQVLASMNDSSKRNSCQSKSRRASISSSKGCSNKSKGQGEGPTSHKSSVVRTLKDHLYQCPSKLSEEMVRCMAAVYYWLCSNAYAGPPNGSPQTPRSSSNDVPPRRGIIEDMDWLNKCTVEISWISTEKKKCARASSAINNYKVLVEQLERVNICKMETNTQIAFWINMYNALVMHAHLAYGLPQNSLRRLSLFHKAAYNVGGHIISASAIEQSIFCLHTLRVGKDGNMIRDSSRTTCNAVYANIEWLETVISTAMKKRSREERRIITSSFGLEVPEPLVCFALCSGAFSDPTLKVYTASNIKEELEASKRDFLRANIVVKKSKKIFLPKLLERFAKEASLSLEDLLQWVLDNVDPELHDSIQKCIEHRKRASQIIEWLPYSSRFRYILSKDLTEKPRWM